jgi:hypothetical protein
MHNVPLCHCDVRLDGTIEDDGQGCLQVDFANRKIGGIVVVVEIEGICLY